jgi:hypothetical protein
MGTTTRARDKLVQIFLTEDERRAVQELAASGDESVSRMIRRLVRAEAERRSASAPKARKETKR